MIHLLQSANDLHNFAGLLLLLFFGHYLADYPLQGDFLAKAKNRNTDVGKELWGQCLFAHCVIHAGMVFLITLNIYCAMFMLITHYIIDFAKCEGRITFTQDQFAHFGVLILIAVLL